MTAVSVDFCEPADVESIPLALHFVLSPYIGGDNRFRVDAFVFAWYAISVHCGQTLEFVSIRVCFVWITNNF